MAERPAVSEAVGHGLGTWRRAFRFRLVFALAATVLAAGCASPTKPLLSTEAAQPRVGVSRILLMPPDIELSELTAGGLLEPNAAWTKTARHNVDDALAQTLAPQGAQIASYRLAGDDSVYDPAHIQTVKLHNAVGLMILQHKYVAALELPTKKDKFDWSLGEAVGRLRDSYDADFALFTYMRDSFSSGGRVALIMVAALLGVGVQGGTQVGFASLVDLNSGEVVWFNLLARQEGDLRAPEKALDAVQHLLTDIPL